MVATRFVCCWCLIVGAVFANGDDADSSSDRAVDMILIVGAAGEPEFGEAFARWADIWRSTGERADFSLVQIGPESDQSESTDRERIEAVLAAANSVDTPRPLWVVLIGHGTWDGRSANFNLVGPDVSAKEFESWVDAINRPIVFANCTSSSGPFINRLSGANRVVVTATKSGSEQNYARFGEYFAMAFGAADADLDHDDSISVREAFLKAADEVAKFYEQQDRLATEHALLEDNNDRKGSSAKLIRGRATVAEEGQVDGQLAGSIVIPTADNPVRLSDAQRIRRDSLEAELKALRRQFTAEQRDEMRAAALPILLKLAALYAEFDRQ